MNEATIERLILAVERLAVSMERMEPPERKEERRKDEEVAARHRKQMACNERKQWAIDHGCTDVRALKSWAASGLRVNQTTNLNLESAVTRNCGEKTRLKIMEWIDSLPIGLKT